MIPFFGAPRENEKYQDLYSDLFSDIIRSGKVLQGSEVGRFERKISSYCKRGFAVAVNSCTDALFFSLVASGIGPGDEVLVTDFSFVASASCILRAGAVPKFVDINIDDYNMDLSKVEISSNTKAMIFVNLYGKMRDPVEVEKFCSDRGLVLIEDAAQSLGAFYNGYRSGSVGRVSCLSFDPTKILPAPGSGGMVLTDDYQIADKIQRLRYHGKDLHGFSSLGYNSQMPTSTAYILSAKMDFNIEWKTRRIEIARYYSSNIDSEKFIVPKVGDNEVHAFHKYVIRCKDRNGLREHLEKQGIQVRIHYENPLHRNKVFQMGSSGDSNYPNAIQASDSVLSLPIHPFLEDQEVEKIVKSVNNFEEVVI